MNLQTHMRVDPVKSRAGMHNSYIQIAWCCIVLAVFASQSQVGYTMSLERAAELLANPATVRQGVSTLSREMQSRDQSRAVPAAIILAHYLRTHGETGKAVLAIDPYGGFDPSRLQEDVLPAYLERARCLAADARVREAVKALDYAKENTKGHQRARVFAAYADMHALSKEWFVAIKQYTAALSYGDDYYKRKNISESVDVVLSPKLAGTDEWKSTHRPAIVVRLNHAKRQYDIERYGEGFVDYRDVRSTHLKKKYQDAIVQYNRLIKKHAGTVYAEAAKFYRAQCQAAVGEPENAIEALESFVQASPLGLYRGEALYEIGRLVLEQGDVDQSERTLNKVLEWISKVRMQARDLKLYAIPQKATKIAAPPEAAQTLSADYKLKPVAITPSMVVNRRTAPWYLARLEWDSRYYLGFIAFYRGDYDKALSHFNRAFEMNSALQAQHEGTLGSFHRRLQNACRAKRLLARPEELKTFSTKEKYRFMLADFYALWEKWEPAERIYREFLNDPGSTDSEKACALRALGEAAQYQGRWEEAKSHFRTIAKEYERTVSAQRVMLTLGMESKATVKQRAERLKKAYEMDRNSDDGQKALFMLGFMYYAEKQPKESLEALTQFVSRYPRSRFIPHAKKYIEKQQP